MIFDIANESRRGSPAIIEAATDKTWTFGALASGVMEYKADLPAEKQVLFLFCRNRISSVLWYLAAVEAGHAVALLDDNLEESTKAKLIEHYGPGLIVTEGDVRGYGYRKVSTRNLWRRNEATGPTHPDLALLLTTSGTTGSRKMVRLTRRNIESNAASISKALKITEDDREVGYLPLHYGYGLAVLNTHLLVGATVVMVEGSLLSRQFWNAVRHYGCTTMGAVPHSCHLMRELDIENLNIPTLLTLTQAGGKLHQDHVLYFHDLMAKRRGRFFAMYGQTEATARIAVLQPDSLPEKAGSAGRPVPNGSAWIQVNGSLCTTPGEIGELVYEGPNVMMGYCTHPSDFAKGDELGGRLYTGDTAYIDPQGFLYILGRAGREMKMFGLRISLDEVENLLRPYGPTAVLAKDNRLLVFCEYGDELTHNTYRQNLARTLHLHEEAFVFQRVSRLPLDGRGKTDYGRLSSFIESHKI